ncbi:polyisoprenoid-binding protein YceI [Haloactinopolyspora alba]|uniref:Polyisoprenoid-binding protein YceI n=1 Tax=Haloactinopolyspora alba TaxID=648780 RepID=A0A2P8E562_9ACTN|nr:YceI family protein [Haloactinopolyspora alba]PSL04608.1 polyisoprenoid-binding protein YceI [Haloactinopolyspora alba]
MAEPVGVRMWRGTQLPTPGVFEVDPAHTTAGFVARHLMVTQVRGRFEGVTGTVRVAEDPLETTAEARLDTASIVTGATDRDGHLRSADFLDVETFPEIHYVSRRVAGGDTGPKFALVDGTMVRRRRGSAGNFTVSGDLTIKGVTRPLDLDVVVDGVTSDPWGAERLALTANGEIDREEYGMTWNVALEAGGWLVSQKVQIEIRAQAVRTT